MSYTSKITSKNKIYVFEFKMLLNISNIGKLHGNTNIMPG